MNDSDESIYELIRETNALANVFLTNVRFIHILKFFVQIKKFFVLTY